MADTNISGTSNAYPSNVNTDLNTQRASGIDQVRAIGGSLAVTSTNIEVLVNGQIVGFVQTLTPSETRNIIKVAELGSEGVIQSVPSNTNGGQLTISRFALYNSNLYNAMGLTRDGKFVQSAGFTTGNATTQDPTYKTYSNPFKTLKDQRVPLEIQVKTKLPNTTTYFIDTYIDCWLSSYTKTIAANTITVTENATIMYSDLLPSNIDA